MNSRNFILFFEVLNKQACQNNKCSSERVLFTGPHDEGVVFTRDEIQACTQSPLIFYSQWHLGRFWWHKGALKGGRKSDAQIFSSVLPLVHRVLAKSFPLITAWKARSNWVWFWIKSEWEVAVVWSGRRNPVIRSVKVWAKQTETFWICLCTYEPVFCFYFNVRCLQLQFCFSNEGKPSPTERKKKQRGGFMIKFNFLLKISLSLF